MPVNKKTRLICSDGFMIFLIHTHITISSPESKYHNDDDVMISDSFLKNVNAKIE